MDPAPGVDARGGAVYFAGMRPRAVIGILLTATLAVWTSACGDPPEREMQQAQSAIDMARAAGAEDYAHEPFAAAVDALKRAQQAVADHDYRLALNDALDSREQAQEAAKEAADSKSAARSDADRLIAATVNALDNTDARLKAAQAAKVPPRVLADSRRATSDAEQVLQEARTAFQRGDYRGVQSVLKGMAERLRDASQDLEAAMPAPAARRHR
jgi:hypothetical protein